MFKRFLLFPCLFLVFSAQAMNNDVYYVRFVNDFSDKEGLLTTFPKKYLSQLKTLKDAHEIWKSDIGTLEKPFLLKSSEVSPDGFDQIIKFIKSKENTKKNTYSSLSIIDYIFDKNSAQRYRILSQMIPAIDYLRLDTNELDLLLNSLKSPLRSESKTKKGMGEKDFLNNALNAGLKDLNKIREYLLRPIKESLLEKINAQAETFIIEKANKPSLSRNKTTLEVPTQYKGVTYGKIVSPHHAYVRFVNGLIGLLVFDQKNNISSLKNVNFISYPSFQTLAEMPNLALFPITIMQNRMPPSNIELSQVIPKTKTFFDEKNHYFCYSFYTSEIGISGILNTKTGKWINIPNQVAWFSPFKNKHGQEKLASIICTEKDIPKLAIIDPVKGTCDQIKQFPGTIFIAATIFESKLIYHFYREGFVYLAIMDLNTYENIAESDISLDFYENRVKPISTYSDKNYAMNAFYDTNQSCIKVSFVRTVIPNMNDKEYDVVWTYSINTNTFVIKEQEWGSTVNFDSCIIREANQFPSGIVVVNHTNPDIRNLLYLNIFTGKDGSIYVGGFDNETKNFLTYKYFPKDTLVIFNQIKQHTYLSIEQLYVIEEIAHRIIKNKFIDMTPNEKQIFESMELEDQNLFLNIFSTDKPITGMEGISSIIIPAKAGAYETPLKGYIKEQTQPHGQKRRAEETPEEEERPTKKQKREKFKEDEESESDETTLNESEDNE